MSAILSLVPYLLFAFVLAEALSLLFGHPRPRRILSVSVSNAFVLLVAGYMLDLSGVMLVAWWILLVLSIGAAVTASVRALPRSDVGRPRTLKE